MKGNPIPLHKLAYHASHRVSYEKVRTDEREPAHAHCLLLGRCEL
jgi:hypothetical protein